MTDTVAALPLPMEAADPPAAAAASPRPLSASASSGLLSSGSMSRLRHAAHAQLRQLSEEAGLQGTQQTSTADTPPAALPAAAASRRVTAAGGPSAAAAVHSRLSSPLSGVWASPSAARQITSRDVESLMAAVGGPVAALFHLRRLERLAAAVPVGSSAVARRFRNVRELRRWMTERAPPELNALLGVAAARERERCAAVLRRVTEPRSVLLPKLELSELGLADAELLAHAALSVGIAPAALFDALDRENVQYESFGALAFAAHQCAIEMAQAGAGAASVDAAAADADFLNDPSNFPRAPLCDEPMSDDDAQSLLAFLRHADITLLSQSSKAALSAAALAGQLYDPAAHWSADLMAVHLRHLDLTGKEFANLAEIRRAMDHAENGSDQHTQPPPPPPPSSSVSPGSGSSANLCGHQIRQRIFLFLRKAGVRTFPLASWDQVLSLFVRTGAGPRLGSILYRLEQIGVAFPSFEILERHVKEIYTRKEEQQRRNCDAVRAQLEALQDPPPPKPTVPAGPVNPFLDVEPPPAPLPLLLAPLAPGLGLAKRLLQLGTGAAALSLILQSCSDARLQFSEEGQLEAEVKRAYACLQRVTKRAHAFLTAPVGRGRRAGCVLASGPKEAAAAGARRPVGAGVTGSRKRAPTFLTSLSMADAERLVRESGALQLHSTGSDASKAPNASGAPDRAAPAPDADDDQRLSESLLRLLSLLNELVASEARPPYATLDALIAGVAELQAQGADGSRAEATDLELELAAEAEERARQEKRRQAARKRARATASAIAATRDWLLSGECAALRKKGAGLLITDSEIQSLLEAGGGTPQSVRGHCLQLADQGVTLSSVAELLVSVGYSHQLALEQQKQHRRIVMEMAVQAGLLSGSLFPSECVQASERSAALDAAIDALLYFNADPDPAHPHPRSQLSRSNYFLSPRLTIATIAFIMQVLSTRDEGAASDSTASDAATGVAVPVAAVAKPGAAGSKQSRASQAALEDAQIRALSALLSRVHATYTAYLHAQKQVHVFLRSPRCELVVRAADAAAAAAAGTAPPADAHSNALPSCTLADVATLFEGSQVGLGVLPLLMELSFARSAAVAAAAKKPRVAAAAAISAATAAATFPSWTALMFTLAKLHQKKLRQRRDRSAHRRTLAEFLSSDDNAILRPSAMLPVPPSAQLDASAAVDAAVAAEWMDAEAPLNPAAPLLQPFEWSDADLDALLDLAGGLSPAVDLLRSLNGDIVVVERHRAAGGASVGALLDSMRQVQRAVQRLQRALLCFLHSAAGYALLRCQGVRHESPAALAAAIALRQASPASAADVQRLCAECGAGSRTLAHLQSLSAAGRAFLSLPDLIRAVSLAHEEMLKQEKKERQVLTAFFASAASALFQPSAAAVAAVPSSVSAPPAAAGAQSFSSADIAAIHLEKGSHPFSLLLLSLSALAAAQGVADSPAATPLEFRTLLHRNHLALVRDYADSVAVLTQREGAERLFDAQAVANANAAAVAPASAPAAAAATAAAPSSARLPATPAMVLSLFEQLEAQISVHDALTEWQRAGRRFPGWDALVAALLALKAQFDGVQQAHEEQVDLRAAIRQMLLHYQLLSPRAVQLLTPVDLDTGCLSLPLGDQPLHTLNLAFASYRAQRLPLESFAHLVRVLQVDLDGKPTHFGNSNKDKKSAGRVDDGASVAAAAAGRAYTLSAPVGADHLDADDGEDETAPAAMPSTRRGGKLLLFAPESGAASGAGAPLSPPRVQRHLPVHPAAERQRLLQQLVHFSEAQPWLDGADDGAAAEPSQEEIVLRRFHLLEGLSWPACHLLVPRDESSAPLELGDNELDELLLAVAVPGTAAVLDIARALDEEGRRFSCAPSLVEAVAERSQRGALAVYMSKFGGLLAALLRSPTVMSNDFFDVLLQHMPARPSQSTAAAVTVDPMLSIPHLLALTQLHFESQLNPVAGSPLQRSAALAARGAATAESGAVAAGVSEETFLATFAHFASSARRGILCSLLRHGVPPYYQSLFAGPLLVDSAASAALLDEELTPARLDALLDLHPAGSLYRTVRTLKMIEGEGTKFHSVQSLIEAAAATTRTHRSGMRAHGNESHTEPPGTQRTSARSLSPSFSAHASTPAAATAAASDPAAAQRRDALLLAMSEPQCSLFSARRTPLPLLVSSSPAERSRELDEIILCGGGMADTLTSVAAMDAAVERFFSLERLHQALSARRQAALCAAYWKQADKNARVAHSDPAAARRFAEAGEPYRFFFAEQETDGKTAGGAALLGPDLLDALMVASASDPALPLLSVLQALQRRDGASVVAEPLCPTRAELLECVRVESHRMKRQMLAARLFDPRPDAAGNASLSVLLACGQREAHSDAALTRGAQPLCRWEGVSAADADALLSSCGGSLWLTLRHAHALQRSGFAGASVPELADALALTHQRMMDEEKAQQQSNNATAKAAVAAPASTGSAAPAAARSPPPPSRLIYDDFVADGNFCLRSDRSDEDSSDIDAAESDWLEGTSPAAREAERQWRSERVGEASKLDHLRSLLVQSSVWSDLAVGSAPAWTTQELLRCARVVRGDADSLRAHLLELERNHVRYSDAIAPATADADGAAHTQQQQQQQQQQPAQMSLLADLRRLERRREAQELLAALSFPSCSVFADATSGVHVTDRSLRSLQRAAGGSVEQARRCLRALDAVALRCDDMDQLLAAVAAMQLQRKEVGTPHQSPIVTRTIAATAAPPAAAADKQSMSPAAAPLPPTSVVAPAASAPSAGSASAAAQPQLSAATEPASIQPGGDDSSADLTAAPVTDENPKSLES